ncbi:transposable element Tcb2 transposase [Trichonephila clavipes]|nr:transposable element Tcb2 transposase [Trichonephila clavipes]
MLIPLSPATEGRITPRLVFEARTKEKADLFVDNLEESFTENRTPTMTITLTKWTGQTGNIQAGSPQGSILSPLLYSLYTHDFPTTPTVEVCLFDDDATILPEARTPETVRKNLQTYLVKLNKWLTLWRISTARGGRVRSTTPAEDRYIVLSAKRNRRTTTQQVANQFHAASGKQISRKTVARRLIGRGLYARRPVVCVPLTRQHRTARLQWCREHHNWTEQDWACVLFSDESRFSLSSDCRRQLIWRENGTAYRPENIQEKDRYPTCSIVVWAGIMINGRTRLHVVENGTITGQRYIDEVLLPHVRLFRGAVGDKFVFMDDNATCHRSLAVQDCIDSEGLQRLVLLARSPDLNPIENVWDFLGRQVAGRNYPLINKNTLIRALTEEWDKLPQKLLDNVVQSMVRRVECCITLQGGHIPY